MKHISVLIKPASSSAIFAAATAFMPMSVPCGKSARLAK